MDVSAPPSPPDAQGDRPDSGEAHARRAASGLAIGTVVASVAVGVCMVLPLVVVGQYAETPAAGGAVVAGGVTATLGVLFRATARNLLRSALGTVIRTASRTATRRAVRRILQTLFAAVVRSKMGEDAVPRGGDAVGLGLGAVALSLSLYAVLVVVDPAIASGVVGKTPAWLVACLAAVPLLTWGGLHLGLARALGHSVRLTTGADGLLLQAYFTMAGSFLPLTTEVEAEGEPSAMGQAGALSLIALLVLHGVSLAAAQATGSAPLTTLASLFLVYAFVFSFPLPPLDGWMVFQYRKDLWFVVWAVTGWVFLHDLPERLYAIL